LFHPLSSLSVYRPEKSTCVEPSPVLQQVLTEPLFPVRETEHHQPVILPGYADLYDR
jgi:hypothetical protein